jgi:hypothetical protein
MSELVKGKGGVVGSGWDVESGGVVVAEAEHVVAPVRADGG